MRSSVASFLIAVSVLLAAPPLNAALVSGRTSLFGDVYQSQAPELAFDPEYGELARPFSNLGFAVEAMLSPWPWLEVGPGLMVFARQRLPKLNHDADGVAVPDGRIVRFGNRFAPYGVLAFRKRINRWLDAGVGVRVGYVQFDVEDTIGNPLINLGAVSTARAKAGGLVVHTPVRLDIKFKDDYPKYFATGLEIAYLYHRPKLFDQSGEHIISNQDWIDFSGITVALTFSARMILYPFDKPGAHR